MADSDPLYSWRSSLGDRRETILVLDIFTNKLVALYQFCRREVLRVYLDMSLNFTILSTPEFEALQLSHFIKVTISIFCFECFEKLTNLGQLGHHIITKLSLSFTLKKY